MIELVRNLDFVIREVDLPHRVHGYCDLDNDERANIYVNSRDTYEQRLKTAKHELLHYAYGDHYISRQQAESINRKREQEICIHAFDCGNS